MRRLARAADDGYANPLVPGLHASADALRLVDELAFSVARLDELASDPPGLYGEVALADDREEALWLLWQITWFSPLEGVEDPFAAIAAARVSWGGDPSGDVQAGPRSGELRRTADAARRWREFAARAGSQEAALAGEASWTPQRRFDRAYERAAVPGFGRVPRYEHLVAAGALGLLDVAPSSLVLAEPLAPTTIAAKRIFGIGDTMNLSRRFSDLHHALEVPVAAFDLALQNWVQPPNVPRITAGSRAVVDEALRARLASVLGLASDDAGAV